MKITYETHYKSPRKDGRHYSTMAAFMERLRQTTPELTFPDDITIEEFPVWREKVKAKMLELMNLPEFTEQPAPEHISTAQREGYRVERWEFFPDDYSVVPFLILIPDSATKEIHQ